MKKQVFIVDDHQIFREGIKQLVAAHCKSFEIGNDFSSGEDLISYLQKNGELPHLLLLDIELKGMNGYEIADWIKKNKPQLPILVLSAIEDEISILRMLKLGVKGYLPKGVSLEEMEVAIEDILNKGFHVTDKMGGNLIRIMGWANEENEMLTLSQKEAEFLKLACSDLTYKEISEKMGMSFKSVDAYRASLFEKFSVKSRVGLALMAVKFRLVKL